MTQSPDSIDWWRYVVTTQKKTPVGNPPCFSNTFVRSAVPPIFFDPVKSFYLMPRSPSPCGGMKWRLKRAACYQWDVARTRPLSSHFAIRFMHNYPSKTDQQNPLMMRGIVTQNRFTHPHTPATHGAINISPTLPGRLVFVPATNANTRDKKRRV